MTENNRIRWGILGLGNIARQFARDLKAHGIPMVAAASRNLAHAQAFASEFGIGRAYSHYAELLSDPQVDCVYIALPNSLHAEWTLAAARAGKSILCEKPFAADPAVVAAVLREVKTAGVFFMEGFMYRCHPQWNQVRELLAKDVLGPIRLLESRFSYNMGGTTQNIRLEPSLLGGGLMDVGCYCVSFSRWVLQSEPAEVLGLATLGDKSRVDEWFTGAMKFASGAQAAFQCGARIHQPSWAAIYGDKGRIEIPEPWKPSPENAVIRWIHDGQTETFSSGDGLSLFAREALTVEKAIQAGTQEASVMTWADTLGQAHAMQQLRQVARLA